MHSNNPMLSRKSRDTVPFKKLKPYVIHFFLYPRRVGAGAGAGATSHRKHFSYYLASKLCISVSFVIICLFYIIV
jgi:hypothetical protein